MRRLTPSTISAAALALVLLALPASGQPVEAKAKALFQRGQTAYNAGDFAKAISLYQEAYALKPLPGFLFNIAQGFRQLGNYERAQFFFSRFVDTASPKDPNLGTAQALLAEVKQKQEDLEQQRRAAAEQERLEATRAATEAETRRLEQERLSRLVPSQAASELKFPPAPAPVVEEPVTKKWWFWTSLALGAAAVGGGVTTGVVVSQRNRVPSYSTPSLGTLGTPL